MTDGQVITIGGDLSTVGARYVSLDERLTPGSLILTDLSHSYNAAGVPASGDKLYNLAWNEASAIIGGGTEETLKSSFYNTFVGSQGAFERSGAGALYGVVSRTDQGGNAARIECSDLIRSYLFEDTTREVAIFIWVDVKQVAGSTTNLHVAGFGDNSGFASNNLFFTNLTNALGPQRTALYRDGWQAGSPGASQGLWTADEIAWGNIPAFNSLMPDDGQSFIHYGTHIIDVAQSGMTYAELDARDAELFSRFFGPGGRFDGDTTTLNLGSYP